MRILLANPRGFCAGVDRAIDIVERAVELLKGWEIFKTRYLDRPKAS